MTFTTLAPASSIYRVPIPPLTHLTWSHGLAVKGVAALTLWFCFGFVTLAFGLTQFDPRHDSRPIKLSAMMLLVQLGWLYFLAT